MNTTKQLRLAWGVAILFAVLFVLMSVLYARDTGAFTLGVEDLERERTKVTTTCQTAEDLNTSECQEALNDLGRVLKRFESRIKRQADDEKDAARDVEVAPTSTAPLGQ